MKLFKSLLVAPATLGLLAPMSATANEVTISDFTPAEQLAITNSRVDGLEARFNNFEAGGFSETTTLSGTAEFLLSAQDRGADDSMQNTRRVKIYKSCFREDCMSLVIFKVFYR